MGLEFEYPIESLQSNSNIEFFWVTCHEIPIKPSNSSGLSVLLLLLPFSFFVTTAFVVSLFRGRVSPCLRACSASACARSNLCCTEGVGDAGLGCVY